MAKGCWLAAPNRGKLLITEGFNAFAASRSAGSKMEKATPKREKNF